jgi:hypothetical protein
VNPLIEERETLTVVLCVVCTLTEVGFTTKLKEVPAPVMGSATDVEGLCSASPL